MTRSTTVNYPISISKSLTSIGIRNVTCKISKTRSIHSLLLTSNFAFHEFLIILTGRTSFLLFKKLHCQSTSFSNRYLSNLLFYYSLTMANDRDSSSSTAGTRSITGVTEPHSGFYRKDPLDLHPSDHTGMQLVTTMLTTSNFMIWSHFMKIALKSKNKLGFVDGTYPRPTDETSDKYLQWSFVDSIVMPGLLTQ
ncbi:UBN2_3 domain-containing protein [Senna tora]|uniref:UBN2_3 domain-containing protein n=1 Tax=Senna tora TaxID=362788 RepID=A0A834TG71_9FABA|nr:UBN2_3 domain-containing protein [Senna tora]